MSACMTNYCQGCTAKAMCNGLLCIRTDYFTLFLALKLKKEQKNPQSYRSLVYQDKEMSRFSNLTTPHLMRVSGVRLILVLIPMNILFTQHLAIPPADVEGVQDHK